MELKIERAHRALAPKATGPQAKPRSFIVKFASYRTKEEVILKAWQKKEVFYNNACFYVDQDYPPTILKRRTKYAEVKKMLKERKVYQSATEATKDMASRGFPVTIIRAPTNQDQREFQLLSTWQVAGNRRAGASNMTDNVDKTSRSQYKDRLQEFRRRSPADEWTMGDSVIETL